MLGTTTIMADTLDEARTQAKSELQPGYKIASENVVCDGRPQTIEAEGSTAEEAFSKVDAQVAGGATVIERRLVRQPGQRTVVVEAFDEQSARAKIKAGLKSYEESDAIRLVATGNKGVLGIGKKPNQYEGSIAISAYAALTFTQKAEIEVTYGPMSLCDAVEAGDLPAFEKVLSAQANVNTKEDGQYTALMLAALHGSVEMVRLLLAAGADANAATSWGATALTKPAQDGDDAVVQALLLGRADPNRQEYDGYTPLIRASMNGHAQVVKLLLAAGANRNATQKHGRTALSFAEERGYDEVVRVFYSAYLADLASDDGMRRAEAESALYAASQAVIPELCELLRHSPSELARRLSAWIIYKIAPRVTDPGLRDQAVAALIAALGDSDEGVRGNAPWGLSIIGGSRAVPALQAAAKDPSGDVRDAAIHALKQLG